MAHSLRLLSTVGREGPRADCPANVSGCLSEFDGRDGPVAFVASDRDAQAMYFVEPNALNRTGLAIGITALPTSSVWARVNSAEDRACALLHT
jgi:hypothetical protein